MGKKFALAFLMIFFGFMLSFTPVMAQTTTTPTVTQSAGTVTLTTTPVSASGTISATKTTSLPKTGIMEFSVAFFVIAVSVIFVAFLI